MLPYHYRYRKNSNIIFTCEHASGRIPRTYGNLGLSRRQLERSKDWYDFGALELTRFLARELKASFLSTNFSRLLIDANRRRDSILHANDSFYTPALKQSIVVEDEEGERMIPIPHNLGMNTELEGITRWDTYVAPYRDKGQELIKRIKDQHGSVYIIPVHSFHPVYNGDVRTVDIDVISDIETSGDIAKHLIAHLGEQRELVVEHNKPWGMQKINGGIWGDEEKAGGAHLIPLDINHKHLTNQQSFTNVAHLLSGALKGVLG